MYSIALSIGNEWQTISSKMRHDKVKNLHSDSLELAEGFNSPLFHSTPLHSTHAISRVEMNEVVFHPIWPILTNPDLDCNQRSHQRLVLITPYDVY